MPKMIQFADEPTWLNSRYDYVTSTDSGVLFGLSSWSSPRRLWLEKRNRRESHRGPETAEQKYGKLFEPLIADEFAAATGLVLEDYGRHTIFVSESIPWEAASVDRIAFTSNEAKGRPCEIKNAWRDAAKVWDKHVPPLYQMQAQKQIAVFDADMAYFAVWLHLGGPPVFRLHTIQRDDGVIAAIRARDKQFWEMVQSGTPPAVDGSPHTMRALTEEYREPTGEAVELSAEYVDYFRDIKASEAEIEKLAERVETRKNQFRAAIGNATYATLPDGHAVTWKPDKNGKRALKLK